MKNETTTIDLCPIDRMISFLTMRYAFRYNTVLNCTEYRPVALPADSFTPLDPRMLRRIILEVQREGIEVSPNDIRNYIESDYVRQFDPVGDYLASCEGAWDGHDHIGDLARTVPTDAPLWHKWFKTWLLAMVSQWQNQPSRLYGNSVAPLLISPQGYHKSTFCRRLLPDALKWGYTDSLTLSYRRQVMLAMSQQLLINLDEFNQISPRVQQGFLKNVIQLPSIKAKRPYGTHLEELPRKASFIATSNMTDILSDPSGNRRFIGIELTAPIDTSRVPDHRQLFAQALQLLRNGSRSWFDKAETEQIMLWNRRYEIQEPADQYFSLCFSVANDPLDPSAEWLSTAEIFDVIKQKVGSSLLVNTLIAFGRKLANMPGMRRRKCETCTRYLVKRVGQ
ncbi:DUF3874 domain-containing protein [Prevotella stercorea]|uniref:VapE domain-containing protein n=1 Tax=Leyella stercorea TaxID=363265 RepID=UPI001C2B8CF5|nr:VapE domain-containing protein [Leyella stercorea]MBU9899070.1 DUF3874 domain-containing protein [Leyella stercorea]MBU9947155.1 DUF3874 domain-containing protein [Leyella stercorea]